MGSRSQLPNLSETMNPLPIQQAYSSTSQSTSNNMATQQTTNSGSLGAWLNRYDNTTNPQVKLAQARIDLRSAFAYPVYTASATLAADLASRVNPSAINATDINTDSMTKISEEIGTQTTLLPQSPTPVGSSRIVSNTSAVPKSFVTAAYTTTSQNGGFANLALIPTPLGGDLGFLESIEKGNLVHTSGMAGRIYEDLNYTAPISEAHQHLTFVEILDRRIEKHKEYEIEDSATEPFPAYEDPFGLGSPVTPSKFNPSAPIFNPVGSQNPLRPDSQDTSLVLGRSTEVAPVQMESKAPEYITHDCTYMELTSLVILLCSELNWDFFNKFVPELSPEFRDDAAYDRTTDWVCLRWNEIAAIYDVYIECEAIGRPGLVLQRLREKLILHHGSSAEYLMSLLFSANEKLDNVRERSWVESVRALVHDLLVFFVASHYRDWHRGRKIVLANRAGVDPNLLLYVMQQCQDHGYEYPGGTGHTRGRVEAARGRRG